MPYNSKAQVLGIGSVISIGSVTGTTDTYSVIGEITDAKFAGAKRAIVDTTSFTSGGVASKLGTILDHGTMTITANRISNDAGQLAVIAAFNAQPSVAYDFKVVLPINTVAGQTTTGDTYVVSGIVTAAEDFDMSLSKQAEFTFTIEMNAKTFTPGS